MAAGPGIPSPGQKYGPCPHEKCGHIDCAENRRIVRTICNICGSQIGHDVSYYQADPDCKYARVPGGDYQHRNCLEAAVEWSWQRGR